MEKQSKISWVLVGIRPKNEGEQIPEDVAEKMLQEAFFPEKKFQLFICGALIEKFGTLEACEEGYYMMRKEMQDYEYGDYGIVSLHEEGNLLFMPIELSEEQIANLDDYIIVSVTKNPKKFRYECTSANGKKINVLLRWKNGNGILQNTKTI